MDTETQAGRNGMRTLKDSVVYLGCLTSLQLGYQRVQPGVLEELGSLPKLQELGLRSTGVVKLPDSLYEQWTRGVLDIEVEFSSQVAWHMNAKNPLAATAAFFHHFKDVEPFQQVLQNIVNWTGSKQPIPFCTAALQKACCRIRQCRADNARDYLAKADASLDEAALCFHHLGNYGCAIALAFPGKHSQTGYAYHLEGLITCGKGNEPLAKEILHRILRRPVLHEKDLLQDHLVLGAERPKSFDSNYLEALAQNWEHVRVRLPISWNPQTPQTPLTLSQSTTQLISCLRVCNSNLALTP